MTKLIHLIEAAIAWALFVFLRNMPLDMASAIGGLIAQSIGPFFKAHETARKNLLMVFPQKSDDERNAIRRRMWNNLGRTTAELPHLPGNQLLGRITLIGAENLPKPGEAALFFSGHIGNWELLPSVPNNRNIPTSLVYRHANNPYVDRMIADIRASRCREMIAKGPRGAFKLAKALKKKTSICMLVDQKMNDGIAVPFFGHDAMTAPAIAQLALHYDLPIIPACAIRKGGAHFEITVFPPIDYTKTGDNTHDMLALMTAINALLETWILEHPEQWFWVHKRWPS